MANEIAPVVNTLNDSVQPASTVENRTVVGLCLSGGGYRAMLFHVGALWRLYDADLLKDIGRISSVSGGSITAAKLALVWPELVNGGPPDAGEFARLLADPVRGLAGRTIDVRAIAAGLLWAGAAGRLIARSYRKHLLGDATLQYLPDAPQFVINATSLQSGVLWRFSKRYMSDYRVGKVDNPTTPLALAVAASSAFPPLLSPTYLPLDPTLVLDQPGTDLHRLPFTRKAVLADGGIYDNLGLETIWKRCATVLVSDGGAGFSPEGNPQAAPLRQSFRVLNLIDSQVRALRKRQVVGSFEEPEGTPDHRDGAYWGIGTDIAKYGSAHFPVSPEETKAMASVPTRLKRLSPDIQKRLINWGYAITDAAIRTHWKPELPIPPGLPYR